MVTFPAIFMRHEHTGETAPAHYLGTDESGRPVYKHVDNWRLESRYLPEEGIHEPLGYFLNSEGNYVLLAMEDLSF